MFPEPLMDASNCSSTWISSPPEPDTLRLDVWVSRWRPSKRPDPLIDALHRAACPAACIRPEPLIEALSTSVADSNVIRPEPLSATFSSPPEITPETEILPEPDCVNPSSCFADTCAVTLPQVVRPDWSLNRIFNVPPSTTVSI